MVFLMFVCLQICIGTINDKCLVKFVNTAEDDHPGDTYRRFIAGPTLNNSQKKKLNFFGN